VNYPAKVDAIERVLREGRADSLSDRAIAEQIAALPDDPTWARAVSHPIRVDIVRLLREGPLSPARASERLGGAPLGTVAYHFRTLERLGVIEVSRRTQRRGAIEHTYRLKRD
jgi:DNA-binding transcriptional ArsR family regulator